MLINRPTNFVSELMKQLTSDTIDEMNSVLSYVQPSAQLSVSSSVAFLGLGLSVIKCHWVSVYRVHLESASDESSGINARRSDEELSLSAAVIFGMRQWCSGTPAVKLFSKFWQAIRRPGMDRSMTWINWKRPNPPTSSRRSAKPILIRDSRNISKVFLSRLTQLTTTELFTFNENYAKKQKLFKTLND